MRKVLFLLIVLTTGALVLPAAVLRGTAHAGATGAPAASVFFRYVEQFGNDDLKDPVLMAADRNGRLYVADRRTRTLFVYTTQRRCLARWEIAVDEDVAVVPSALAVDGRGNVLIADAHSDRVHIFSPSGALKATWYAGDTSVPAKVLVAGIAPGAAGDCWFSDHACDCLYHHDGSGDFRTSVDFDEGAGPGAILSYAKGRLAVLFPTSGRIGLYAADGRCLRTFGRTGTGDGMLRAPGGMAVRGGMFYVADTGNGRVQAFSTSGAFLGKFGRPGFRAGEFEGPVAVAVPPSGRIFVLDRGHHRIQEFEIVRR